MLRIRRVVLDILKPLEPDSVEFTMLLAETHQGCNVHLVVQEVDKDTETLNVTITATDLDLESIKSAIIDAGASLHSIDEVEVENGQVQS